MSMLLAVMVSMMRSLALTLVLILFPALAETPQKQYIPPSSKAELRAKQEVSRGIDSRRYLGVFEATSYNLTKNRTASGDKTRIGIVAVDPEVIPLGTKLYIEGYGPALASDTGGKIIGRIVDVWLPGDKAWDWGRRKVRVWEVE